MSSTTDQISGRVKQATGDLTGDRGLKTEGKIDEQKGSLKERIGDAIDAVSDKLKHRDH